VVGDQEVEHQVWRGRSVRALREWAEIWDSHSFDFAQDSLFQNQSGWGTPQLGLFKKTLAPVMQITSGLIPQR
jgi:hypothetical protein